MRPMPLRIVRFENGQGVSGSVVLASVVGTCLETVTEIRFSGSGIQAQILRPPSADRIDVAISIAADAAPGPRAIQLLATRGGKSESDPSGALFHVLARSGYTSASGIGSHLI
jgi:hypothetical protein